ncbi:MAG: hypothetical protein ACLP7P_10345 [Rhodomicrobium sp.]
MSSDRPGGKGFDLEEALKIYFSNAGYFAVRGIPYRLEDEDVTDVDLWLYERPAALTRRRLIVDAKNRKSPKALERIIWTKGLQAALGVDGAIVATTDKRPSSRRLSKALNITILDGDAVSKLMRSEQLQGTGQLKSDDLNAAVRRIDEGRRSGDLRQQLYQARASLITGMGVQSTNTNLAASGYFAEQAILAQPRSEQAQIAVRLFYLTSAFAAISLDFVLADQAFRSAEERKRSIIESIRFGSSDTLDTISTVRVAIGLVRKYVENGGPAAKQLEYGFFREAEQIRAEVISDYVTRISASDSLFNVARELERSSLSINLPSYDQLSVEAKSLLGTFLDFNGVSREKVANAWLETASSGQGGNSFRETSEVGPLFEGSPLDPQ